MRTLLVAQRLESQNGMVSQAALVEPAVMGTLCELKIFFPIPFVA